MPESALGDMHSAFSVVFVLRLMGLLADERAVDTRLKIPLACSGSGLSPDWFCCRPENAQDIVLPQLVCWQDVAELIASCKGHEFAQ